MNNADRLNIYKAQCLNVAELRKARTQLNITINEALRTNKSDRVNACTKALALVYSAWAEASFSKLIHTPHGLTLLEIAQVKEHAAKYGTAEGWKKCIVIALQKANARKSNFNPNARQRLNSLVKQYIFDPSLIRNKVAHGQWHCALNSKNTATTPEVDQRLRSLDPIELETLFCCVESLIEVVEFLVESPKNHFMQVYWTLIEQVEKTAQNRQGWNLATKRATLLAKKM